MRYWVIAPYANDDLYGSVWNFDLEHDWISIGWSAIGDVSTMTREQLKEEVEREYPDSAHTLVANMLWNFYNEIREGDTIVARKGLRVVSGVGVVANKAKFLPGTNTKIDHPHFIKVSWQPAPRNVDLGRNIFHQRAVAEIASESFEEIKQGFQSPPILPTGDSSLSGSADSVADPVLLFGLEKELENFLVVNWGVTLPDLEIYIDDNGRDGQQYPTEIGPIDILAIDKNSRDFVVIELKRNRSSDTVLGQVQRYMGWVKKNLCRNNQKVRGLIICGEQDARLSYGLAVTQSIELKYYKLAFSLSDEARQSSEKNDL